MKWLIASDIHGSAYYCEKLIEAYQREEADKMLLLGDILYHGPRNDLPREYAPKQVIAMLNPYAKEIVCVRGNCDAEVDQMVLDFPIMADYALLTEEVPLEEDLLEEVPTMEDSLEEVPLEEDSLEEVPLEEDLLEEVPLEEDSLEEVPLEEDSLEKVPTMEDSLEEVLTVEDSPEEVPTLDVLEIERETPAATLWATSTARSITIFATHGHIYNTKKVPPLKDGDILLHGHTHVPACEKHDGYTYLNPGSVSIPKENSPHSYMVFDGVTFEWKNMDGNTYKRVHM